MKYSEGHGIKSLNVLSNELFRSDDANYLAESSYQNHTDILANLVAGNVYDPASIDYVLGGLEVIGKGATLTLKAGMALSLRGKYFQNSVFGYVAAPGEAFSIDVPEDCLLSIPSNASGANARFDVVEIRPVMQTYDSKSRQFRDPITSLITSALTNTKTEFSYEVHVLAGNAAVPNYVPPRTAGWIKLAEVKIEAGSASVRSGDVTTYKFSRIWLADNASTLPCLPKKITDLNKYLLGRWAFTGTEYPDAAVSPGYSSTIYFRRSAWDTDGWTSGGGTYDIYVNNGVLRWTKTGASQMLTKAFGYTSPAVRKFGFKVRCIVNSTPSSYVLTIAGCTCTPQTVTIPSNGDWIIIHGETDINGAPSFGMYLGTLDGTETYSLEMEWFYISVAGSMPTNTNFNVTDLSGNGNDGIAEYITRAKGISGKAMNFDPYADAYINLPYGEKNVVTTEFTVTAWVQGKTRATNSFILQRGSLSSPSKAFRVSIDETNVPEFHVTYDGSNWTILTADAGDEIISDCFLSYVFKGGEYMRIYKNNVLIKELTTGVPQAVRYRSDSVLGNDMVIGRYSSSQGYFDGWMDDLRYYKKALTTEELSLVADEITSVSTYDLPIASPSAVPLSVVKRDSVGGIVVPTAGPYDTYMAMNRLAVESLSWDLVIDSNSKLDQWIQHTSGLYKRVLIRAGIWTASVAPTSNVYIDLTRSGTRFVFAEPGSLLVFNNALSTSSAFYSTAIADSERDNYHFIGVKVSVYTSDYTGSIYGFNGLVNLDNCNAVLTIPSGGLVGSSVCFTNCLYLNDCVAEITSLDGNASGAIGYFNCKLLNKCNTLYISSTTIISLYAFYQCNGLSLCSVNLNSLSLTGGSAYSAFANCTELSSCSVSCTSVTSAVNLAIVGYDGCTVLASCKMYAVSYNRPITGFKNCDILSSCFCNLVTHGEYAVGFQTCNYISACNCTITQTAAPASMLRGFALCKGVSSCYVNLSGNANVECTGFHSCTGVSVCIVGAVLNAGTGAGYGFNTCTKTINNKCSGTTKTGKYTASYADVNTNACALTAAGGYND